MNSIPLILLSVLVAYAIGNISPSIMLAKARGIDIKKEGSGNAGTTNALRVMGKKAGVNEYALKKMVGHIITDLTERVYTDRDLEWLRNEIEKI